MLPVYANPDNFFTLGIKPIKNKKPGKLRYVYEHNLCVTDHNQSATKIAISTFPMNKF